MIRFVEVNGDVLLATVPNKGVGDVDIQPDDIVIGADTPYR